MPNRNTSGTPAASEGVEETRLPATRGIDLEALAEKVYRLLKEEARLERERLGRRRWR